jgi:hypothetical protein
LEIEEVALEGDGLAGKGTANDFERLVGARAALLRRYAEARKLFAFKADSDAKLETAARYDIDRRDVLGETYRIVKGIKSTPDAMRIRSVRAAIAAAAGKIEGR